jgi:prepilin-type processing-associated H-X9-DG protein
MDHPHLKPEADLRIVSIASIGLYAINIAFSDGHARGIYPWPLLREFAAKPKLEDFLID